MPHDMFRAVIDPFSRRPARAPLFWPVSFLVHVLLVAAFVVIPLAATDILPQPRLVILAFTPPAAPPPPPAPPAVRPARTASAIVADAAAPLSAPSGIRQEDGLERIPASAIEDLAAGVVPGGVEGSLPVALEPPPAPAPSKPEKPVPIGGLVKRPEKVRHVPPAYPAIAQAARVEGIVILEAVISETGEVEGLRVLKGVPLLDEAAIDAVRQWRFTPTLLNGIPVRVMFTVTVQFKLQ